MSATSAFHIRRAAVGEREAIREFEYRQHLESTGCSPAALAFQTADLALDFPCFESPEAFAASRCWVAQIARLGVAEGLAVTAGDSRADQYAGVIGWSPSPESESTAYLYFLSVHRKCRRFGLASKLLRTALETAVAEGFSTVHLVTVRHWLGDAIRLYERIGFRLTSERYYPEADFTALHMDLDLAEWWCHTSAATAEKPVVAGDSDGQSGCDGCCSVGAAAISTAARAAPAVLASSFVYEAAARKADAPAAPPLIKEWPGRAEAIEAALRALRC
jgi:ribosomal protein S18 acetylase RimI-like enzyme